MTHTQRGQRGDGLTRPGTPRRPGDDATVWYLRVRRGRLGQLRRTLAAQGLRLERLTEEVWRCIGPATLTVPAALVLQCTRGDLGEGPAAPPAEEPAIGQLVQVLEGPARGLVGLVAARDGAQLRLHLVVAGKGQQLTVPARAVRRYRLSPPWDTVPSPAVPP